MFGAILDRSAGVFRIGPAGVSVPGMKKVRSTMLLPIGENRRSALNVLNSPERNVITIAEQHRQEGPNLWERDPDRCCHIRKVEPLGRAGDEVRDDRVDRAVAQEKIVCPARRSACCLSALLRCF